MVVLSSSRPERLKPRVYGWACTAHLSLFPHNCGAALPHVPPEYPLSPDPATVSSQVPAQPSHSEINNTGCASQREGSPYHLHSADVSCGCFDRQSTAAQSDRYQYRTVPIVVQIRHLTTCTCKAREYLINWLQWAQLGWDRIGSDAMGSDGMGSDGIGWDGMVSRLPEAPTSVLIS